MSKPDPSIDIDCGWTDEVWAWKPEKGRWSHADGRPRRCVDIRLSTPAEGGAYAYDSWRDTVFCGFDADALDPPAAARFSASLQGLISHSIEFYAYDSAALSGRRTKAHIDADGGNDLDIGLVLRGTRHYRHADGSESVAGPGEFFIHDTSHACEIHWEDHAALHLSLNRLELQEAAGLRRLSPDRLHAALRVSPLSTFLRAQLLLLRENIDRLADWEREAVLTTIKSLAVHQLRGAHADMDRDDQGRLFRAACAFIQAHLPHPALSVAMIAERLGCSRATLYRSFSRFHLTVAGYVREQRLLALRERLSTLPAQASIADVAAQCGLYDAPNVSRLFRARFGVSPSEVRPAARTADTPEQQP